MVLSVSRHLSGDSTNQSNTPLTYVAHPFPWFSIVFPTTGRKDEGDSTTPRLKQADLQTATSLQSSLYAPTQTIKGHHDADCQQRCPSDHETALFNVSELTNATTYPDNIAPLQQKQLLSTTCSIAACHLQSDDRDQCGCMSSCFRFCGAQAVVFVGSR